MLKNWLNKRKLKIFLSEESTWKYKLDNHRIMETYSGVELTSVMMDSFEMTTKCGSVEKLIHVLTSYLDTIEPLERVPTPTNVSRDKGGITLTNYLTNDNGYPYLIAAADEKISELLVRASVLLDNLAGNNDTRHSYYSRMLKPYITEAMDFRILVHDLTQP